MALLKVLTSDSQDFIGKQLSLEGEEVTIGRSPESNILVPDAAVSRRHAKIVRTPEGLLLVDDGGRNGLFVNGERVTHKLLADGDVVRVGHTEMAFEAGDERQASRPAREAPRKVAPQRPPARERLEQTTMLEAALLMPPEEEPRPARQRPAPEAPELCPSCGTPLARGSRCSQCDGDGEASAARAPGTPANATVSRVALAIALLLAGVLLVTGVLVAREKGMLGHRGAATAWGASPTCASRKASR
jgi:pSer/pThr/pTyr-binding forkhead associated (FHA) protein